MAKKADLRVAMPGVVFAALTIFSLSLPSAMAKSQHRLAKVKGTYAFRMAPDYIISLAPAISD